jgi:hypothetical protein
MTDSRVDKVLKDIEYLYSELARYDASAPLSPRRSNRGRPKSSSTIERELDFLGQLRAWLHSQLTLARGEPLFAVGSGFDVLEKAGVVAPPQPPREKTARGRGRPKGSGDGERLAALADWVHEGFRRSRHPITKRRAIEIASGIREQFMALGDPDGEPERQRAASEALASGADPTERRRRRYYETVKRRRPGA